MLIKKRFVVVMEVYTTCSICEEATVITIPRDMPMDVCAMFVNDHPVVCDVCMVTNEDIISLKGVLVGEAQYAAH